MACPENAPAEYIVNGRYLCAACTGEQDVSPDPVPGGGSTPCAGRSARLAPFDPSAEIPDATRSALGRLFGGDITDG